jgi:peptidoglycan biosynthesis protein MviN/MurJ (putative lipid II flippase)
MNPFHGALQSWRVGDAPLGPVGIAFGSSCGAWLEWLLLRASLTGKLGHLAHGRDAWSKSLLGAVAAGAVAGAVYGATPSNKLFSLLAVGLFGVAYLCVTWLLRLPEARELIRRVARRRS